MRPQLSACAAVGLALVLDVRAQSSPSVEERLEGPIRPLDLRFQEAVEAGEEAPRGFEYDVVEPVVSEREDGFDILGYEAGFLVGWFADDNIRRRFRRRGDIAFRFEPTLSLAARYGRHRSTLAYAGKFVSYSDFNDENYIDHAVTSSTLFDVTKRFKAKLDAGYAVGTESRNSLTGRQFGGAERDQFITRDAQLELVYGRRIAKAQVTSQFSHSASRYQNNGQEGRDIDQYGLKLKAYYNFSTRLSGVFDFRREWLDYRVNSPLDGVRTAILFGVRWDATAKTSGEATFGREKRQFDDRTQGFGRRGDTWDVSILWEPRTYSKLNLTTSQSTQESAQGGDGTALVRQMGASWNHGFDTRWSLSSKLEYSRTAVARRRNKELTMSAALGYKIYDNLSVTSEVRRTVVGSTDQASEYENNIIMLQLNASYAGQ